VNDTKRVLVVDPSRGLPDRVFGLPGLSVEWEQDGERAVGQLLEERFDACLVGSEQADRSGVELIRDAVRRGCHVPLILCTRQAANGDEVAALEAGAVSCVDLSRAMPQDLALAVGFASAAHSTAEQRSARLLQELGTFLAHEGKNALAGIGGAVQVVADHLPADSADRLLCGEVRTRLDAFASVLDTLTMLLRPLRAPAITRVSLGSLLRDLSDLGPGVRCDVEGEDLVALGDATLLRRAFAALLQNAAEAAQGRGSVRVSIARSGGACQVEITDSGLPLPPGDLNRLLELFHTTKRGRPGLGLPLAYRIAEAHGGGLSLGRSAGGGLRVTVRLLMAE